MPRSSVDKKRDFVKALEKVDREFQAMRQGIVRPRVVIEVRDGSKNHFSIRIEPSFDKIHAQAQDHRLLALAMSSLPDADNLD